MVTVAAGHAVVAATARAAAARAAAATTAQEATVAAEATARAAAATVAATARAQVAPPALKCPLHQTGAPPSVTRFAPTRSAARSQGASTALRGRISGTETRAVAPSGSVAATTDPTALWFNRPGSNGMRANKLQAYSSTSAETERALSH